MNTTTLKGFVGCQVDGSPICSTFNGFSEGMTQARMVLKFRIVWDELAKLGFTVKPCEMTVTVKEEIK